MDQGATGFAAGPAPRFAGRARSWRGALAAARRAALDSLEQELAERAGFHWLAVVFAAGCLVYFVLPQEPAAWPLFAACAALSAVAAICHARDQPWRAATLAAACLAGMSAAKFRVDSLDGPRLERSASVELSGRVVDSDRRAGRRPRIVLDSVAASPVRGGAVPERVRLTLGPRQELPPLGAVVSLRARIGPVAGPAVPGGYDPRRAAFFDGIGASGFVLGGWQATAPPQAGPALLVERIRAGIVGRILRLEPGEPGAVAAALLVGERSALSEATNESLRISGLAHILSISGLHMMLISGTAFFLVRALLALSPRLALSHPIRKWAAGAALVVVTAYFALSGGGAATLRAYVMAVIMFAAVLLDRPAISMRNLALAAFVVLGLEPEGIMEPGFQMSFAAVAALIAGWEAWRGRSRARLGDDDGLPGWRVARWAGAALGAVLLTSLVAGLATAPFSAYHFERVATYSLLGNLLAASIVSAVIMPAGLLTLVFMPLGLEALPLFAMARGIELLLWVSDWVAGLPGADLSAPTMTPASLLLMAAGMLWICLWRRRWRLAGLAPLAAGVLLVPALARPADILVAGDGKAVAVRDSGGVLRISGGRAGSYLVEQFLAEESDPDRDGASLREGVRCDPAACLLGGRHGVVVSHVLDPAAFGEDCRRADVIATPLLAPPGCAAPLIIDGKALGRFGAHAGRLSSADPLRVTITAERSATPRPWQAAPPEPSEAPLSISAASR